MADPTDPVEKTAAMAVLPASAKSGEDAQHEARDQTLFRLDASQLQAFEALLSSPLAGNTAVQRLLSSHSPWE